MRKVQGYLTGMLLVLWSLSAALAYAQTAQSTAAPDVSDIHKWVVLLDASASFGDKKEPSKTDIRDEALFLLQHLLAILQQTSRESRRQDYLSVFRFGAQVEEIWRSKGPVTWENIQPTQWQRGLSEADRRFTVLDQALNTALEELTTLDGRMQKHVVIISDGELDIPSAIRRAGTLPGREEELRRYRIILPSDGKLMQAFRNHKITLHTLTVDPQFQQERDDTQRQETITKKLYSYPGRDAPDKALARIEELAAAVPEGTTQKAKRDSTRKARTGPARQVPRGTPQDGETEGPYVMRALADFTEGKARSVHRDNLLDVLWEVILPGYQRQPVVPPETRTVYVFARTDREAIVHVQESRQSTTVSLGPGLGPPRITPPNASITAEARRAGNYVTWEVKSVQPITDIKGDYRHIFSVNHLRLQWRPSPVRTYSTRPLRVQLDLVRQPDSRDSWDLNQWRHYMAQVRLVPKVTLQSQKHQQGDAPQRDIELTAMAPSGDQVVASFTGVIPPTAPGWYNLDARLTILDSARGEWSRTADAKVISASEPVLYASVQEGTRSTAYKIPLAEPEAGGQPVEIPFSPEQGEQLLFEQRLAAGVDATYVTGFALALPEINQRYDAVLREWGTDPESKEQIIWRSASTTIPPSMLGKPLLVVAENDSLKLFGRLRLQPKGPPPPLPALFIRQVGNDTVLGVPVALRFAEAPEQDKTLPLHRVGSASPLRVVFEWRAEASENISTVLDGLTIHVAEGNHTLGTVQGKDNQVSTGLPARERPDPALIWRSLPLTIPDHLQSSTLRVTLENSRKKPSTRVKLQVSDLGLPRLSVREVHANAAPPTPVDLRTGGRTTPQLHEGETAIVYEIEGLKPFEAEMVRTHWQIEIPELKRRLPFHIVPRKDTEVPAGPETAVTLQTEAVKIPPLPQKPQTFTTRFQPGTLPPLSPSPIRDVPMNTGERIQPWWKDVLEHLGTIVKIIAGVFGIIGSWIAIKNRDKVAKQTRKSSDAVKYLSARLMEHLQSLGLWIQQKWQRAKRPPIQVDFSAVQGNGFPVHCTLHPGKSQRLRVSVHGDYIEAKQVGRLSGTPAAPTVDFLHPDPESLALDVLAGDTWAYRLIPRQGQPGGWRRLGPGSEPLSFREVVIRGAKIELRAPDGESGTLQCRSRSA